VHLVGCTVEICYDTRSYRRQIDLKEMWVGMEWINLAQDRDKWRVVLNLG
jgi:hypothetical protein